MEITSSSPTRQIIPIITPVQWKIKKSAGKWKIKKSTGEMLWRKRLPKPPHCDKIFLYFLDRRERQMGKLYFTRHGQTVWHGENKICGNTDVELTDLGAEQAQAL